MLDLIYDRTAADVANNTAKGRYAYSDLNRVETAVATLASELRAAGISIVLITKTDWHEATDAGDAQDTPTAADMTRYLDNVAAIRGAIAVYRETPPVPGSMARLTWQRANDIERILADVEVLINNMIAAQFFSGEIYCGEAQA